MDALQKQVLKQIIGTVRETEFLLHRFGDRIAAVIGEDAEETPKLRHALDEFAEAKHITETLKATLVAYPRSFDWGALSEKRKAEQGIEGQPLSESELKELRSGVMEVLQSILAADAPAAWLSEQAIQSELAELNSSDEESEGEAA